jgi:hypothetical protein
VAEAYEIAVRGRLGAATLDALGAREPQVQGHLTHLTVVIADQAELHRILGLIAALGLALVSVHEKDPDRRLDGARRKFDT